MYWALMLYCCAIYVSLISTYTIWRLMVTECRHSNFWGLSCWLEIFGHSHFKIGQLIFISSAMWCLQLDWLHIYVLRLLVDYCNFYSKFWFIHWDLSFTFVLSIVTYLSCVLISAESSPRTSGPSDDWRSAFDAAANGPTDSSRYGSNGHSRRYPAENGDASSGSKSSSRRTPNRMPPAPPGSSYKY